ncbi:MBL fold metallo-hydrolase [Comamonas serinivorans]|uniref:MBL fold metallo-hydrolase n=1 Tax=Comamonas serinivorans TaxID=1082851 RepID=A0A1Y0EJ74_9BURK|nr:MBL fold metallo-hydrolase [Comamonas serinivorans]ARU03478.1 MBL fold metallo-hydrolase [Comamonas serinivorans]
MYAPSLLPPGVVVFERGWLSANNILLTDDQGSWLVDTGYVCHTAQTVALVAHQLGERTLDHIVNTHLHSDHCGGNAGLQARWPGVQTWVPQASWAAVQAWDERLLSHGDTGQDCDRFRAEAVLTPGQVLRMAGRDWQVIAAPGHDDDAVVLFEPEGRVLLAGDAIWGQGLSVVFPELWGQGAGQAFERVAATLDRIEQLAPRVVVPGHGAPFTDVAGALAQSRSRLAHFRAHPEAHAQYAAKVLLKFHLLAVQQCTPDQLWAWATAVPYLRGLHQRLAPDQPPVEWLNGLLQALVKAGAASVEPGQVHNR